MSKYPCTNTMGVPLSPLPEVRSAQGAEQIRKPPGRRPLGRHVADQIAFLVPDRVVDGIAQSSAREARKVVVGEILDLHFIGPGLPIRAYTPVKPPDPPIPKSFRPDL